MAVGNKHLAYKDALNDIEARSPGAKFDFFHGYLARAAGRFGADPDDAGLGACVRCGAPSTNQVCAFCSLVERAGGAEPVRVDAPRRRS